MWVVKIGGSLNKDPLLPQWLDLLTELGGGRVIVVCGGGEMADSVRRSQAHWRFDDVTAHNMATLAMVQGAYLLKGLKPALQTARTDAQIRQVLRRGQTAVWLPLDMLCEQASDITNWDVTSDSLALGLALRLNAERLLLLKSCAIEPGTPWVDLGTAGVVDGRFASLAQTAPFPIDLVHRDALARVRDLLLGGGAPVPQWAGSALT
jgi:5-(aminomethyl)-3-furanmethanol phosphate kinase